MFVREWLGSHIPYRRVSRFLLLLLIITIIVVKTIIIINNTYVLRMW